MLYKINVIIEKAENLLLKENKILGLYFGLVRYKICFENIIVFFYKLNRWNLNAYRRLPIFFDLCR